MTEIEHDTPHINGTGICLCVCDDCDSDYFCICADCDATVCCMHEDASS